mmetsp:Transcript_5264/g.14221  ORF Transcript_5264/g.14221 Transcript_5264/m.14221 type:complete len:218 (+) Transcript_5264:186-839(+)
MNRDNLSCLAGRRRFNTEGKGRSLPPYLVSCQCERRCPADGTFASFSAFSFIRFAHDPLKPAYSCIESKTHPNRHSSLCCPSLSSPVLKRNLVSNVPPPPSLLFSRVWIALACTRTVEWSLLFVTALCQIRIILNSSALLDANESQSRLFGQVKGFDGGLEVVSIVFQKRNAQIVRAACHRLHLDHDAFLQFLSAVGGCQFHFFIKVFLAFQDGMFV